MASLYRNYCRLNYKFFFSRSYNTVKEPDVVDLDYLKNPLNHAGIIENCRRRGVKEDVPSLLKQLSEVSKNSNTIDKTLRQELIWLPNKTHPRVLQNPTLFPTLLEEVGIQPQFHYSPATFDNLAKRLNLIRTQYLGHISGKRSYYLKRDLASLERSLIQYTNNKLFRRGFILMTVPDIVHQWVFGGCGMKTEDEHSQVFKAQKKGGSGLYLSGTAEMSIAAYCAEERYNFKELPLRFCATSRCFRAEAKRGHADKGIYRVHYFTKVEMFGVTAAENGQESEQLLQEFSDIQKELFSELGLHFKVMEMASCDLGLPAYRKIDIEAWMPGKKIYGEISSASNCTDYQARRLNTTYTPPPKSKIIPSMGSKFCHTVNGTACAIPRMLIAIFENFQNLDGSINVPVPLQKYMRTNIIKEKFDEKQNFMKPVG